MLYTVCMGRARRHPAVAGIDPEALAAFQAGIRKRYTDEEILAQLTGSAERLGRSPTMREFAADSQTTVHPQTVIEHFGSWNAAKRQAGLVPRRFATREELLGRLRALGEELGRTPTARDIDARKGAMPSKSLLWHTFGSLAQALREAGFDVPVGEERLERAVEQGATLARTLGRLPKMADWADGAPRRPVAPDRVAGLPDDRRPAGLGGVPVPRARTAARGGRRGGRGRQRRLTLARAGGLRA